MRLVQIGVAGSATGDSSGRLLSMAAGVGRCIANAGAILIFGGNQKKDHLPNAAYHAAHAGGGMAVAIVEGTQRTLFAEERTIIIPCGEHGRAWESAMAYPCDALIVIGGKEGTLEEMKTAHANGAIIIALRGTGGMADAWIDQSLGANNDKYVIGADTPEEAVQRAIATN